MLTSRRHFLRTALAGPLLLSLAPTTPPLLSRMAAAGLTQPQRNDTILVTLQLTGGNDGLNTVVPFEDPTYARQRPTLRLPERQLHRLGDGLALHPRMEAFQGLFEEGQLQILQGVGYAKQNRDHEAALRIWQTAEPEDLLAQTGWLGRAHDCLAVDRPQQTQAAFIGRIPQPFSLTAAQTIIPSLQTPQDLLMRLDNPRTPTQNADASSHTLLDHIRETQTLAAAQSRKLNAALANDTATSADYPAYALAKDLRTIAQIIRADIGFRLFFVELGGGGIGGFDNHANQIGNHCSLLGELAESVSAFIRDLNRDRTLDRVLLVTFSEFGRTVAENGRRGTGHGAAAPVVLAGGRVKGGIIGSHPSLTDLDEGAMKHSVDFRQLYATVLDDWLQIDSMPVLGKQFETLDLLQRG